jgi:gamma-glutamyl-gamma-aminobutyrate hydrolase PuuD
MAFMRAAKSSFSVFAFVILFAGQCMAAKLVVWQPTEASVPLIISRADNETPEEAAAKYLAAFNADPGLVKLSEGPLNIPLQGLRDLEVGTSTEPMLLVLTSEPQQFRGSKNGKSWYKDLSELGTQVYVLPVMHDAGLTDYRGSLFRRQLSSTFDGMLSLGGADVDPSLYGEANREAEDTFLARDVSEMKVIKEFLRSGNNACFGICRGAQLIAITLGYKLHQDIAIETTNGHYHVANGHPITWIKVDKSLLKNALEKFNSDYPSQHHEAVIAESNPDGELILVAAHQPGPGHTSISEAFEFKNHIGFLTQWHYERDRTEKGPVVMKLVYQETKKAQARIDAHAQYQSRPGKITCSASILGAR